MWLIIKVSIAHLIEVLHARLKFEAAFKGLAILWLAIVVVMVSRIWLFTDAAWLHAELVNFPEYIWTPPRDVSLMAQLRTLFDWQVFDLNHYRLRPLSDLLEVVDALTRPTTIWLFRLHPSLTLSALLLAALTAVFFYKALRHFGLSTADAALLTAIFLTTIGYLSCFVSYIRPAKKIALFCICLSLYLISRYIHIGGRKTFAFSLVAIFSTLFTDEVGYPFIGIATFFLLPFLLSHGEYWRSIALLGMLPLFLIVAKLILPKLYFIVGYSGLRNEVIPLDLVSKLLGYLIEPKFYVIAVEQLSRAVLGSFGLSRIYSDLSVPFLLGCVGVVGTAIWSVRIAEKTEYTNTHWQVVAATAAVFCMGFSPVLFNWYNAPFQYDHYASMTYYYSSPVVVFAVLWLAFILKLAREIIKDRRLHRAFSVCLFLLVVPIGLQNYVNFRDINKVIQIFHLFPLDPKIFQERMDSLPEVVASLPTNASISIELVADSKGLIEIYYPLSRSVLGRHSIDQGLPFDHPMGTEHYVKSYVRTFYPNRAVDVRIVSAPE